MSADWSVYEYEASMYADLVNLCAKGDHRRSPRHWYLLARLVSGARSPTFS
jgi:hypothetical protein